MAGFYPMSKNDIYPVANELANRLGRGHKGGTETRGNKMQVTRESYTVIDRLPCGQVYLDLVNTPEQVNAWIDSARMVHPKGTTVSIWQGGVCRAELTI